MSTGQVRVEGAGRLRRTLRQAGADLADLRELHARIAGIVGIAARFGAPRGKTGRLAGSIRVSGTATASIIRAGFASVPYAPPIHWGWRRRNIKAQPFISEAAQATEDTWFGVYVAGVESIIKTIEGK